MQQAGGMTYDHRSSDDNRRTFPIAETRIEKAMIHFYNYGYLYLIMIGVSSFVAGLYMGWMDP